MTMRVYNSMIIFSRDMFALRINIIGDQLKGVSRNES